LVLAPEFRRVADRLYGSPEREARLSQAAIEVLALVAYRQPVTRQEVDGLRGTNSGALLRQLVRRDLIAITRGHTGSRDVFYSTTERFLEVFRLSDLEELPRSQDLDRL
jgi:segregation and condensation protein B